MRQKQATVVIMALGVLLITGCSKKHVPEGTAAPETKTVIPAKKTVVRKTPAVPVAKVIVVNDSVAKKNIDGRLYYDVGGHRYWRNYDDGKYYLFNKAMYTDKAFKPH
jgi:hypothetical protein